MLLLNFKCRQNAALSSSVCNFYLFEGYCTVCGLTQVQVADIKALLSGQVTQQRAEVRVGGHAQRVAAELEDLLSGRVSQRVPRAAEAFTFARLSSAPHVLCVQRRLVL